MKSFSIATVLLVVASGLAPAFAAPIPSVEYEELVARATSSQDTVTWLKDKNNAAAINAKPICFYSGNTNTETKVGKQTVKKKTEAKSQIGIFMKAHSCDSISEVIGKAGATGSGWSTPEWENVSEALAAAVNKPTTYVLLGKNVGAGSAWLKKELPALKTNKLVKTIEAWEIATDGSFVKSSAKLK